MVSRAPNWLSTAPASRALLPPSVPPETVRVPAFTMHPPLPVLLPPVIMPVFSVLESVIVSVPLLVMTLPFVFASELESPRSIV